jgi:hypothetical protein
MPIGLEICLKIMVSPVRIRVPPLLKVLQIVEKDGLQQTCRGSMQQRVNSRSRERFFERGRGGVSHAVRGVG